MPWSLPTWFTANVALHGAAIEDYPETTTGPECGNAHIDRFSNVTPHFYELQWLLVFFEVQFKVLVIIFKAQCDLRPGSHLSLGTSASSPGLVMEGMFLVPSIQCYLLWDLENVPFVWQLLH